MVKQNNKNLGGDLISPGLYLALDSYTKKFGPLLPFTFAISERSLVMGKSRKRRLIVITSSLFELLHTLLTMMLLFSKLTSRKTNFQKLNDTEIVKLFTLLYFTILPPTFMAMNFTIALTPRAMLNMINTIDTLRNKILGDNLIFCNFFYIKSLLIFLPIFLQN